MPVMNEQEVDSVKQQKDVAFYSALVSAWVQTQVERDKTLASLSAGGIGLLVTILSIVGVRYRWQILLYCCAFLFFAVVIVASVVIFDRNSKHIEDVIKNKVSQDYVLKRLDKLSLCSFILAALFSIAIGVVAAVDKLDEKGGAKMSDEKKTENTVPQVTVKKSLEGIGNLNPVRIDESLEGIANLRPQPDAPSNQGESPRAASSASDSQASAGKTGPRGQSKEPAN